MFCEQWLIAKIPYDCACITHRPTRILRSQHKSCMLARRLQWKQFHIVGWLMLFFCAFIRLSSSFIIACIVADIFKANNEQWKKLFNCFDTSQGEVILPPCIKICQALYTEVFSIHYTVCNVHCHALSKIFPFVLWSSHFYSMLGEAWKKVVFIW